MARESNRFVNSSKKEPAQIQQKALNSESEEQDQNPSSAIS